MLATDVLVGGGGRLTALSEETSAAFDAVAAALALGADAVLSTAEDNIAARVKEITGGAMVPYALDCIGGPGVVDLLQSLAPQGRLLVYDSDNARGPGSARRWTLRGGRHAST